MAGNKINTKTKGKEDKGKASKGVTQSHEDCDDVVDFAILRKPIPTSVTGFAQARKIFDLATEELKDLLSNECDLMYECKVCRNVFRSLANFISHKRVYCQDKFSSTVHSHFVKSASTESEMLQIKRTEESYQESLKIKAAADSKATEDSDDRIPLTKDITEVYEKIINAKGKLSSGNPQVVLKKIPSSTVAVFQHMSSDDKASDSMKAEVQELDQILSRKRAVLKSDGKFVIENENNPTSEKPDGDNVIQISDDEDNDDSSELKCKICDLQFSTMKTLKFHMKYKHLESRLVYPCPDCLEIFSTSWSVYRHLFKVHRKSAAQIRRLRESIQSKAFKMNNPPAFYEKRKNMKAAAAPQISEEERRDQENQAWMDNMEGDGEVPRCGGCGRTFERRAALAAHTHTCQPRSRALARAAPRPDAKRIEIQIRKDYNKGPPVPQLSLIKPQETEVKNVPEDSSNQKKLPNEEEKGEEKDEMKNEEKDEEQDDAPMDVEDDDEKSSASADSPEKNNEIQPEDNVKPVIRLPYAPQAEKSNLAAFKQRVSSEVDIFKLQCKRCESKHNSVIELYDHVADHVKWMRYACKLCNFKHYSFDKLPEHVKVVHKLKGDSDFYYTTVKAIDGKEAMMMSACLSEPAQAEEADPNESPESRRPSRCSSDSSRLSDDSSSSSTLKETINRKRKSHPHKGSAKKRKDANDDGDDQEDLKEKMIKSMTADSNNSPSLKAFEENSSDLDEIEEKITKRLQAKDSISSRRPVRKRTKVKNADFEYDLSNLLKMEAQGYRESQTPITPKPTPTPVIMPTPKPTPVAVTKMSQPKKKSQSEATSNNNYESLNQDCCGALFALSKKAADVAAAHMRSSSFALFSAKETSRSNVFVRPMIPRILARGDKSSPKKDVTEDGKDNPNANTICKISETVSLKCLDANDIESATNHEKDKEEDFSKMAEVRKISVKNIESEYKTVEQNGTDPLAVDNVDSGGHTIPAVVPLNLRRQSLELMTNHPIINKNITDFSKSGMKTKILVIKPIRRNKDGKRPANALKFQTIKLKDPSKGSSSEAKPSDQVMVVKVPKVPCSTVSDQLSMPPDSKIIANVNDSVSTEQKCKEIETANNIYNASDSRIETNDKQKAVAERESNKDEKASENKPNTPQKQTVSDNLVVESTNNVEDSKAELAAT